MADLRAEAPPELAEALTGADPGAVLEPGHRALLEYARKITETPAACSRSDVDRLRDLGATDEAIHATVQVAAYFNYINRVADALGVDLEPEMRGRPSDPS